MRFPAGTRSGSYLHALLERIDFRDRGRGHRPWPTAPGVATRFGLDHAVWGDRRRRLAGARHPHPPGRDRPDPGPPRPRAAPERAGLRLRHRPGGPRRPRPGAEGRGRRPLPPLGAEPFAGMVTGVIDLVFEHGGRWYIADYKSNYLGPTPGGLCPGAPVGCDPRPPLRPPGPALHPGPAPVPARARLPGYAYGSHFGGVYYLFLRGMHPRHGPGSGVHVFRPDPGRSRPWIGEVFACTCLT